MELARLGMQTAYTANAGPVTGTPAVSNRQLEESGEYGAVGARSSQPPSSTQVSISAAAQTRLAVEQQASPEVARTTAQQSATVQQNVPVQASADAPPAVNQPNTTADSMSMPPSAGGRPLSFSNAPTAQQSVTTSTGGATPGSGVEAAVSRAPAPPMGSPQLATPGSMGSGPASADGVMRSTANEAVVNSAAPRVAQDGQQQRVRQDAMAQSRQDVSPVLAQSSIAAYQGVLRL